MAGNDSAIASGCCFRHSYWLPTKTSWQPVGIRTYVLIALGAALFTVVSIFGFSGVADPSRVAAGVVIGIGFN